MIKNLTQRSYAFPLTVVLSFSIGYTFAQILPDFYYSLRMFLIENFTRRDTDPAVTLDKSGISYHSIVLPIDINRNMHMNNFRYIRELNFAR